MADPVIPEPQTPALPAAPAPAPAPVAPPPPAPPAGPTMSQFEAMRTERDSNAKALKELQDKSVRFEQAMNLLQGKTEEKTAALPPDVVKELHNAKSTAEKAWRTLHAQSMATELKAVKPQDVAAIIHSDPAFAVDDDGRLVSQDAAQSFLSKWKQDRGYAFVGESAAPAGPPSPTARAPVTPNPQGAAPVPGKPPTPEELNRMPRAERLKYQAEAIRSLGGEPQRFHN